MSDQTHALSPLPPSWLPTPAAIDPWFRPLVAPGRTTTSGFTGSGSLSGVIQRAARAGHQFDGGHAVSDARLPSSGGRGIPDEVRQKMESGLGADFADVRLHESPMPSLLGARAFTQGRHVTFAPGLLNLKTSKGQALLGHELTHVVQQRSGQAGSTAGATQINRDPSLEREADLHGLHAARGDSTPAAASGAQHSAAEQSTPTSVASGAGVVQLNGGDDKKKSISRILGYGGLSGILGMQGFLIRRMAGVAGFETGMLGAMMRFPLLRLAPLPIQLATMVMLLGGGLAKRATGGSGEIKKLLVNKYRDWRDEGKA